MSKNLIYSIKQTDFCVIVKTKSGKERVYLFPTIAACNEYYNQLTKTK